MPLALRERAFFSSEVEKVRLLQRMQDRVQGALDMLRRPGEGADGADGAFQTREKFVVEMQQLARDEGLDPRGLAQPERYGTLQDITSGRRLRLIYDQQKQSAEGYAQWKAEQDTDVLDAYPAQELVRVETRKHPRGDWRERFEEAGGTLVDGRMVALKSDPVWAKLSRFGTPWPPFDFGSGMGLRDVNRDDAEKLGLLKRGDKPKPAEIDFNKGLQATIADLSPAYRDLLKKTFGGQITVEGDAVKWNGARETVATRTVRDIASIERATSADGN
jgi:hypothetical protein